MALLENYYKLSIAINEANNGIQATTANLHTILFHGAPATLSSILAMQEKLRYRKRLVDSMTDQLATVKGLVANSEEDVSRRCDQFLAAMGGGDKGKLSAADIDAYSKNFNQNNDLKLVDPLNLETLITKLKEENETLDVECDSKISEINALTQIDVDLA